MNRWISYNLIPLLTGDKFKPQVFLTHMNFLNWFYLKKAMLNSQKYLHGRCIDIGAGEAPYAQYILPYVDEYIIIDNETTHTQMFQNSHTKYIDADIQNLPFENESVDTIILTQVLEHIKEPFCALSEIKRVLKKDGILILSVPFIYQAHATPYDYYRFSEYGLKHIIKKYSFQEEEFIHQGYIGTTLVSIINGFVWEQSSKYKTLRNTIFLPFLLVFFLCTNLLGLLLDLFKNKNFTPNFWMVLRK